MGSRGPTSQAQWLPLSHQHPTKCRWDVKIHDEPREAGGWPLGHSEPVFCLGAFPLGLRDLELQLHERAGSKTAVRKNPMKKDTFQ